MLPILVIYFAWRFLILWFLNPFDLFVYVEEELYRGWVGKELFLGLKLPFWDYRADNYSGGSILMGVLSSVSFRIFGLNAWALKTIPFFLFGAALAAWYALLKKQINRRIAVYFSLFFIFSPYLFTRFTLTVLGDHAETIFFTAASLFCFFKILDDPPLTSHPSTLSALHGRRDALAITISNSPVISKAKGLRNLFLKTRSLVTSFLEMTLNIFNKKKSRMKAYAALFGMIAGLGLWMAYIYGFTLLAMLAFLFVLRRNVLKEKNFWIFTLFFLIGFSPWLYLNTVTHFEGLRVQGTPIGECFHWKFFLKRLWDFRTSAFYRVFAIHDIPGPVPNFSSLWAFHFYRFMFTAPVLVLIVLKIRDWKRQKKISPGFARRNDSQGTRITPIETMEFLQTSSAGLTLRDLKQGINTLLSLPGPVLFSVIYLFLFLFICQMTPYKEIRYFIPCQPFLFLLAVYSVDRLAAKLRPKLSTLLRFVYLGALIINSLCFHVRAFALNHAGALPSLPSARMDYFLLTPACAIPDQCLKTYQNFRSKNLLSSGELLYFRSGVAQKLLEDMRFENPLEALASLKLRTPKELHDYEDYYFGYEILARNDFNMPKSLHQLEAMLAYPDSSKKIALSGFLRDHLPLPKTNFPFDEVLESSRHFPESLTARYWRVRGFQWAEFSFRREPDYFSLFSKALSAAREFPEKSQDDFLKGVGRFVFWTWQLRPFLKHPVWDRQVEIPSEFRSMILEGAGIQLALCTDYFYPVYEKEFLRKFSLDEQRQIQKGLLLAKKSKDFFTPGMV